MKTYEDLVKEIEKASDEGLTMEHAERVAATSLFVMNNISEDLSSADKNARMRKQGLKAIKSAVRQEEIKRHDKKPTENQLDDIVNLDSIVQGEETAYDEAEVTRDTLERQYSIARESHLYFRSVAKGSFNG